MSPSSSPTITPKTAEQVADTMFALSTPSRVQILGCLLEGPLAVGEVVAILHLEQSAVSHQLRILRENSLVKSERVGKRRLYAIYDDAVRDLLDSALRHVEHPRRQDSSAVAGD